MSTIAFDYKSFFDRIRASVFGGSLTADQVEGCKRILTAWEATRPMDHFTFLAYILATSYHETAHTMQPVREIGQGKGRAYGKKDPDTGLVYYGRGDVQLTWKRNYALVSRYFNKDFVNNPDLALDPYWSARILIEGSMLGWFTGKSLKDYRISFGLDYVKCRAVINGKDRATMIAGYARHFEDALRVGFINGKGDTTMTPPPAPEPKPLPPAEPVETEDRPKAEKPFVKSKTLWATILDKFQLVGLPLLGALAGIDWKTVLALSVLVSVGFGLFVIRERWLKHVRFGL
jgi:putative chitinase